MSLLKFIKQENAMAAFFNDELYPEKFADLTEEQKTRLGVRIDSALSPECLTCDGELRGAKLKSKSAMLQKAKAEFIALGGKMPVYCYD
jgi:hypothetical protein